MLLIAINVVVFAWEFTLSQDPGSASGALADSASEYDVELIEYGAIPYRITHPGEDVGSAPSGGARRRSSAREHRSTARPRRPRPGRVVPLDALPWWVTVFTSMFMHGGILHIAGNMLFLWVFGNNIEDAMGRVRFVAFYLLAGWWRVYAQALLDTSATVPTVGASGAVAGVLGAYALLYPARRC